MKDKFVEYARESHMFIQSTVQQYFENGPLRTDQEVVRSRCRMILEKLNKLKTSSSSDEHSASAERLLDTIESLLSQQRNMIDSSELEEDEIDTEHERACVLKAKRGKRAANIVLAGFTVAGAAVLHPHMGAAAGAIVRRVITKACNSRAVARQQRHESAIEDHKAKEGQMFVEIKELGDQKFLIHKVVNEIDSLLRSVEAAIKGDVDFHVMNIKNKMGAFRKQIDQLDGQATGN